MAGAGARGTRSWEVQMEKKREQKFFYLSESLVSLPR
jgi:hypothetical protein